MEYPENPVWWKTTTQWAHGVLGYGGGGGGGGRQLGEFDMGNIAS